MLFRVDGCCETNVQVHRLPLALQIGINLCTCIGKRSASGLLCIGEPSNGSLVPFIDVLHNLVTCIDAYCELFS